MTSAAPLTLAGSVWLTAGGDTLGGKHRVALLQAVAEHGSITRAAKAINMSYKAAWEAIDTMNNLAGEPLVARTTGGRGGGATRLTLRGQQLVARFAQIDALHQRFVQMLSNEATDLTTDLDLLRIINMKTSARNQWLGTVTALRSGAVNDEVTLTLRGGSEIVAIVTRESSESLGLQPGSTAFALVPASAVLIACGLDGVRLSARNQLAGSVSVITPGAVNADVVLALDGGGTVAATITMDSLATLDLSVGSRASAVFKASSVIIGSYA
ncbi:Molybdenum-pterin-binding protein MopA [Andreprevotia sp. IGB-42]|uniref:TOBE domain-containing protein n=1 Tax=Andreprevotia sp. IGB-42 TaxID=2497473 RepID=UPI00135AE2D1|nr:TOBE domain-containing protein [Andreprevotia sp. IGB-42]KAF0811476.1 Molybdenum-pterin-binding protein MopA [Andreprevotia sp. IGB-42]